MHRLSSASQKRAVSLTRTPFLQLSCGFQLALPVLVTAFPISLGWMGGEVPLSVVPSLFSPQFHLLNQCYHGCLLSLLRSWWGWGTQTRLWFYGGKKSLHAVCMWRVWQIKIQKLCQWSKCFILEKVLYTNAANVGERNKPLTFTHIQQEKEIQSWWCYSFFQLIRTGYSMWMLSSV